MFPLRREGMIEWVTSLQTSVPLGEYRFATYKIKSGEKYGMEVGGGFRNEYN